MEDWLRIPEGRMKAKPHRLCLLLGLTSLLFLLLGAELGWTAGL